MIKKLICLAVAVLIAGSLNAQKVNVNVNHFTGTANIIIPLESVQSGACNLPINLVYSTNGVKSSEIKTSAGHKWQVTAGGEITRELRGLPDDYKITGSPKLGWIYNTKGTAINSFSIANDNNPATCTDESTDISYITSNFSDLADTEPDVFYVNAPGLSCKLMFDNNSTIRTIPYQDLKITYTTDTSNKIVSFNLVNDKGISYSFAAVETSKKTVKSTSSNILYFKNEYSQYSGLAGISYVSSWKLSKITDPNGNFIEVSYDQLTEGSDEYIVSSVDSVNFYTGAASGGSSKLTQYVKTTTYHPLIINWITYGHHSTSNPAISFSYFRQFNRTPVIKKISGFGKEILLGYSDTYNLLTSLTCNGKSYNFTYYAYSGNPNQIIPDSTNKGIDLWGYLNNNVTALKPEIYVNPTNNALERYKITAPGTNSASYPYLLSGSNRNVNSGVVTNGSLKQIAYTEGGTTTLTYESNDYYDPTSGSVVQGGGIRLKQVTEYDGISTANNVTRTISYLNPATGLSSGKAIGLPVYAFTTPYNGSGSTSDLWNYSTVRSETDLTENDNSIIYSHVKESMTGTGSTLYEFSVPATNWDLTASPDWTATVVNVARPSCTSYGFVRNDVNTYPFPPNTNYEFERGLLKKQTSFTEAGTKVSEATYTYTRTGSPVVITGFKWDDNAMVKAYAKYQIYTSVGQLGTQVVNKVYDSGTLTTAQEVTSKTFYTGVNHKLPTQTETTNSDGSILRTYMTYTMDYNVSGSSDPAAMAIGQLQTLNLNIPVEMYSKVERGGVNRTISAELVKFSAFNPTGSANLYLPVQKLNFKTPTGVTDFAPAVMSGGVLNNDSRYFVSENYLAYDFSGFRLSSNDNNKNVRSLLTDHVSGNPVASVANATINEIGYNDFNSEVNSSGFIEASPASSVSTNSRTGKYALALNALSPMTRSIQKNVSAGNYIFSIWVNSMNSGTVTLSLTNASSAVFTYSLPFVNGAGKWKYYELKVPVTSMSATFTASFKSSIAVLIDDVLFYPENAEVSTIAYDPVSFVKTAETNTNGVSRYFSYDEIGRLKFVYDQDKQIILKKTYSDIVFDPGLDYSIQFSTGPSSTVDFSSSFPDYIVRTGMTFEWDFGDGSTIISNTSNTQQHVYTAFGTFTAKVKITSSIYGVVERTVQLEIKPKGNLVVNYSKLASGGSITSIVFTPIGGGTTYTFTEAQLLTNPSIARGSYTVTIYYQKIGVAFKSLRWQGDNEAEESCIPITSTANSPATIVMNLGGSNYLYLIVSTSTCLL